MHNTIGLDAQFQHLASTVNKQNNIKITLRSLVYNYKFVCTQHDLSKFNLVIK